MSAWWEWRDAPPGRFAVIGDPISHSLSPRMHTAALATMGETGEYRAIRVAEAELAEAVLHLRDIGYQGLNITVPLKHAALRLVGTDDFAFRCGAVNTVDLTCMSGINTDGAGFLAALGDFWGDQRCKTLLLGAGGAARSVALALCLAGYPLYVYNRTRAKAVAMVEELRLNAVVVDTPDLQEYYLVVNATSSSLNSESLPLRWGPYPDVVAFDLMYGDTPFLQEARSHGYMTLDGKAMLVEQGALSLEYWLGKPVPRDVMMEAIR